MGTRGDIQGPMNKVPEKGILKKHGYGAVDGKDKWVDDQENLELGSQSDSQEPAGAVPDLEYKMKVGFHAYATKQSLNIRLSL